MTDTPLQIREREARELLRSVQSRRSCDVPSERVVSIGCAIAAIIAAVDAEREQLGPVIYKTLLRFPELACRISPHHAEACVAAIRNPEGGS